MHAACMHSHMHTKYLEGVVMCASNEAQVVTGHNGDGLLVCTHASITYQTQCLIIVEGPATPTAPPTVTWRNKGNIKNYNNNCLISPCGNTKN